MTLPYSDPSRRYPDRSRRRPRLLAACLLVAILGVLRLLQGSIAPALADAEQPRSMLPAVAPASADAPLPRDDRADVGTHERDEPQPDLTLPNEFALRVTVVDA